MSQEGEYWRLAVESCQKIFLRKDEEADEKLEIGREKTDIR